jgi:hypothetical protein
MSKDLARNRARLPNWRTMRHDVNMGCRTLVFAFFLAGTMLVSAIREWTTPASCCPRLEIIGKHLRHR